MNRFALTVLLALTAAQPALTAEFEGQVTCSECWAEADRSQVPYGGEADLACAKRCADKGVPPALAVHREGSFELLLLEGRPVGAANAWLDLIGRFVQVSGTRSDKTVQVTAVRRLEASPWGELPAATTVPAWVDLGGHRFSLDALHGRIVVLNFWATWCDPCRKEMPDLARVQSRYGMFGVQVVGAAADTPDQQGFVQEMARKLRVNFPIVLGATTAQMQTLGLGVALPATVILDRHGDVVKTFNGVVSRSDLEQVLDGLVHDSSHTRISRLAPVDTRASLVPS